MLVKFALLILYVMCVTGSPLWIGAHVPCVVSGDSALELSTGDGRVVQVKVDPKIVASAKVSRVHFVALISCFLFIRLVVCQ